MASPQPEIPPLIPGTVLDIKLKSPKSVRCKTELDEALQGMNAYSKVYLFERPCTRCKKTGRVCVTSCKKTVKCEWCRASKVKCDVELIETIEYRWLDCEGSLHRDSEFSDSTVASSTCDPDDISALAPEEVVQVNEWVNSTKNVESLDPSSPQDFGAEVPLTREAVSRIVQDDIRSDRCWEKVRFWQKKLQESLLDIPTVESAKRAIATMISSDEEEQQPRRKIRVKIRPAARVGGDSTSPPNSRTSSRSAIPQRSRNGSPIGGRPAHYTHSARRNSTPLPPPLFLPGSNESGSSPTSTNSAKIPSNSAKVPSTSAKVPSNSAKIPSTSAKVPSNSAKIPSTSAKIPSTSAKIPSTSAKIPSTSAKIPSTSAKIPSTSAKIPAHPVSDQILAQSVSRTLENPLVQTDSLLENERRNNESNRPLNENERPTEEHGPTSAKIPAHPVSDQILARSVSRTLENPLVQTDSLLENERRNNESNRPLNENERPTEEHGQGGNEDTRPNKEENNDGRNADEALSVDSIFEPDPRLFYHRTAQTPSSECESDSSSVQWRDVEPIPKPAFDGKIIAREVRKQAKLLEKFIENKTVEIAALIPQGKNFDSFKAIRQEIRTQLKKSKESLGTAVTPLEL